MQELPHVSQVVRMLRLRPGDINQVAAFQSIHEDARQEKFGYMFRSPSLWEDMIKSITLCNCGCASQQFWIANVIRTLPAHVLRNS